MSADPETLRTYAAIFEKRRRDAGVLLPLSEPCIAAAKALRFYADHLEEEAYQERITKKIDNAIR